MMRILCFISALFLLGSVHAASATHFNWDLSYQRVLRDHPIDKDELMHLWTKRHPERLIQDYLSNYEGPEIESAVLIEQPDSQLGSSVATLFYVTEKAAGSCRFHRTNNTTKVCGKLERNKVLSFVNAMKDLGPIKPSPGASDVIGTTDDGRSITAGYFGFVSIFHNADSSQRPIVAVEMNQPHLNAGNIEHWGRIVHVMSEHLLSDAQKAQLASAVEKAQAQQR